MSTLTVFIMLKKNTILVHLYLLHSNDLCKKRTFKVTIIIALYLDEKYSRVSSQRKSNLF